MAEKLVNYFGMNPAKLLASEIGAVHADFPRRKFLAARPFLDKYPRQSLSVMRKWARSKNFHLRRLASEGLRPRLPWAKKLTRYVENPKPVFEILAQLKIDEVRSVRKSVANNLRDYAQANPSANRALLADWERSDNPNTQWIVKQVRQKLV